MKKLALLCFALGCHDATAPVSQKPFDVGAYGLVSINGDSVPTEDVESGVLVFWPDSSYTDAMYDVSDQRWHVVYGRYSVRRDTVLFTPHRDLGMIPYSAPASYDSVRVIAYGLNRLFKR